jgi:hypothetical protein
MKLLVEQYLKGIVSFETSSEAGTTFQAMLPRELDASAP